MRVERRSRSDEEEEDVISIPSKVSGKPRHTWNLTHDQMRIVCWAMLLWLATLLAATNAMDSSLLHPVDEDGVCPMKCACLDSYIQCTKLNLATAPSRVPKWAEFL